MNQLRNEHLCRAAAVAAIQDPGRLVGLRARPVHNLWRWQVCQAPAAWLRPCWFCCIRGIPQSISWCEAMLLCTPRLSSTRFLCEMRSPATKDGYAIHVYTASTSMDDSCLANADGDFLIVPQQGTPGTTSSRQICAWTKQLPGGQPLWGSATRVFGAPGRSHASMQLVKRALPSRELSSCIL